MYYFIEHLIKMKGTFQVFRPHFDALARIGYFKVVLKHKTNLQRILHYYYRIFVWIGVLAYNVQHIVRAIEASSF